MRWLGEWEATAAELCDMKERFGRVFRGREYWDAQRGKRVRTVEVVWEEFDDRDVSGATEETLLSPIPVPEGKPPQLMSREGFIALESGRSVFVRVPMPTSALLDELVRLGAQWHEDSGLWVMTRQQAVDLGFVEPQRHAWIEETLPEPLSVGFFGPDGTR